MIHFIIVLFFQQLVHAQNVTSSFDRNILCTNPAAAATRGYSQLSLAQNIKNVDSKISVEESDNSKSVFEEDVKINTSELRLTGGHSKIVPEFYVGFNDAKKSVLSKEFGTKSQNSLQFVDNFLNLAFRRGNRLSLGLKMYYPNFGFESTFPSRTQAGTQYKSRFKLNQNILGITLGSVYALQKNFFIGAFANFDREKRKSKNIYLDFSNDSEVKDSSSDSEAFRRYGIGMSYINGSSRGHGFRAELSYSTMNVSKYEFTTMPESVRPVEIKSAVEVSWRGLSFGGTLRMVKAGYFDQSDYLQRYFIEQPATQDFTKTFGGFLSLNSKRGHSFGLSGYYYPAKGKRQWNGAEQPVESKTTVVNLNYAYLY